LENTQKGISRRILDRFAPNLVCCRYGQYKCHQGSKMSLFENSRWRRTPFWKIHKRAYLGQFLTNLHQIWCADIYGQFKCHQRQKNTFRKFKMAAECISANSLSIYTKFGMLIGTVDTSVTRCPKCHFLENQDGGARHSGKYTKGYISANS